jgi:hypothetical protein
MGMGIVGGSFQFGGGKGFSAAGRQEGLNGESLWRNEERRKKRPTGQLNFSMACSQISSQTEQE